MLYVVFTSLDHSKFPKFEKIPFRNAVRLSQQLEMEMREQKKVLAGDFHLIRDDNNESYYSGTFNFGSGYAPNLFIHIKKNLPKIKTDKEKEKKRIALMAEMDELTEEAFKHEEDLEQEEWRNLDKSKISHFKKWQRRTIYGIGVAFALAFFGSVGFFFIQIASFNTQYQSLQAETQKYTNVIDYYEKAVLGETDKLKAYLAEDKNSLDEDEKHIYASYLAEEEDFEGLVNLFDDDPKLAVTFLTEYTDIEKVKAFDELFPTNEAKFDIAYAEKNYEELISIENVEMTTARSKRKTYALLKTGNIEEAKAELENNNDQELAEKITKYEDLRAQITDLDDQIKNASKDKSKKLNSEKSKLEDQLNEI